MGIDEDDHLVERQAFVNSVDRSLYVFSTLNGNRRMVNKIYARNNTEAINETGDWQIKVLNMDGQPDIGRFITGKPNIRGEIETSLSEILDFFDNNGVRRVMIFDYSCSNVADVDFERIYPSERSRRLDQRNILVEAGEQKLGWGGKKQKKYKRKTKKNKSKKSKKIKKIRTNRRN